jgi:hypothetical protein
LRRGWTRFWLCASVALGVVLCSVPARAQGTKGPKHENELTLAGLRPGRDTLAMAFKRYKKKYLAHHPGAGHTVQWRETCTGRSLTLQADDHAVIQEITVSSLVPRNGSCTDRRFDALHVQGWVTGRGLRLGDPQGRVTELYGEPNSSGPSVRGEYKLIYLYYSFDGGGPDVPQVMEVYCARDTGRVVEITLAYPSL